MSAAKDKDFSGLYRKIYGSYIDVTNSEKTVDNYSKLAESYEEDFVGMGYDTPQVLASEALKLLQETKKDLDNCKILDIACGTGLVAQGLRNDGFKGSIDGIDGSEGMLKIAEEKGLYQILKEQFISIDKPILFDDNSYDAIVCCGGFGPGHLIPAALQDLIRVTKSGGLIVYSTRYNEAADAYVKQLTNEADALVTQNKWEKVKIFLAPYFCVDLSASEEKKSKPLLASIYCYRKK
ncbi:methyltransferase-like protein 27 [Clavelina lepadiformis]|uniref:methyltransferase-like protein 27 n=1 Tax=Clavelina lepadiformis TaxID=159417 RepID=UPI004042C212